MLSGVIDRARSSAKSMVLIYGWALTRSVGSAKLGLPGKEILGQMEHVGV
jgi:hypothetical protein